MRTTTRFDEVRRKTTRRGKCSGCGKKTSRVVSAHQMINPWNTNAQGIVKTHAEIDAELVKEIETALAKPLQCSECSAS